MDYVNIRGVTMCTVSATLSAGTTTTFSNTGAVAYCIEGKAYSVAAASNKATPTTDINTGEAFLPVTANKGCVFVIGYDSAASAAVVAQGEIVDLSEETDGDDAEFLHAPEFPVIPADFCPFGYILTKVGSGGSDWTFGSSNLAGPPSNVHHTYVDVMTLPARPQVP